MLLARCCSSFATLSRAAAKKAAALFRQIGGARVHSRWGARAQLCETCPLLIIHKKTSYCGQPLLHKLRRDPTTDGCGCPTHEKAKSPDEHCPLTNANRPATHGESCDCKWCRL